MKFLKIISISFMVFILFYAIDNIITQKERSILYTGFPIKGSRTELIALFSFSCRQEIQKAVLPWIDLSLTKMTNIFLHDRSSIVFTPPILQLPHGQLLFL